MCSIYVTFDVVLDQFLSTYPSRKIKSGAQIQSADRPEIGFKVASVVIESVNFAEFNGFYDVIGNF